MGDIGRVTGKVRYEALFYWGPHRPREGRGDLEPFVGFHLSYRSPERLKVVRCPAGDKGLASFYPSHPSLHPQDTLTPYFTSLPSFSTGFPHCQWNGESGIIRSVAKLCILYGCKHRQYDKNYFFIKLRYQQEAYVRNGLSLLIYRLQQKNLTEQ